MESPTLDASSTDRPARPKRRVVPRSNFFVAALWAPVPPIVLGAAACLWVLLFPESLGLGETARWTAGAILIGLPVVYTGIFGASYFIARGLHGLGLMSRVWLICVCALVALVMALILWLTDLYTYAGIPLSAGIVALSFFALSSAALLWWWVAVTVQPMPEPLYEKRPRIRRKHRRDPAADADAAARRATVQAVQAEPPLNELIVRWDPNARRLLLMHPDRARFPGPLAEIGAATLEGMTPQDASRFIGDYLTRLLPELRATRAVPSAPGDERKDRAQ